MGVWCRAILKRWTCGGATGVEVVDERKSLGLGEPVENAVDRSGPGGPVVTDLRDRQAGRTSERYRQRAGRTGAAIDTTGRGGGEELVSTGREDRQCNSRRRPRDGWQTAGPQLTTATATDSYSTQRQLEADIGLSGALRDRAGR